MCVIKCHDNYMTLGHGNHKTANRNDSQVIKACGKSSHCCVEGFILKFMQVEEMETKIHTDGGEEMSSLVTLCLPRCG